MSVVISCNGVSKIYKRAVSIKKIIRDLYPIEQQSSFVACLINRKIVVLDTVIHNDASIIMIDENNKKFLNMIRFTCIQLLNKILKKIWPNLQLAGGKITDSGFYCDFYYSQKLTKKDLKNISDEMHEKISLKYNIFEKKICKDKFIAILKKQNEIYQIDIIQEKLINLNMVKTYSHENYIEFCNHSQLPNIVFCSNFYLQEISGAYWKNNKKNKMLQRIHGIAWSSNRKLLQYINFLKESEKRDHRKIAKKLNLYHIHKNSPGMIFWHHNGLIIFNQLKKFIRNTLIKYNYEEVKSPILIDKSLWKKSGHWKFYRSSIFTTNTDNGQYCIKPMNCPGHVQIFKQGIKSYKDLPVRISEFGSCHRDEPSGALHGLLRVRGFTQDDAHIFCTKDQVKSELNNCIKILFELYKTFGFKKITVKFSTRPIKRIGDDNLWDQAEKDLKSVLIENNLSFCYQKGEGAFYGPKIEIALEDNLKRIWQCGTIQLDFYLAHKLNAFYIDKNNVRIKPIIIHRAFLGSIERFIGILIEEYNGHFPIWLSPIQVVVLSISENNIDFVKKVTGLLKKNDIRTIFDISKNSINFKIRTYIMKYIPYILICGDRESKNNFLTIRLRSGKQLYKQNINKFVIKIRQQIIDRSKKDFYMEG